MYSPPFAIKSSILIVALIAFLAISSAQNSAVSAEVSRWQALQPEIEKSLSKESIWNDCPEEQRAIVITQAADVTGDGLPEAVVEYCHMGAYTSNTVIMRLVNGRPVIARLKEKDGQVDAGQFIEGASAMHGLGVFLLPQDRAVYAMHWDTDDQGELSVCSVQAFTWAGKAGIFEWNAPVTSVVSERECSKLRKELHQMVAPDKKP